MTNNNYSVSLTGLPANVLNSNSKAFNSDYPFKQNFVDLKESEINFPEGCATNSLKDFENEKRVVENFQKFIAPSDTDSLVINQTNKINNKIYDNFVPTSGINEFKNYEKQTEINSLDKFLIDIDDKTTSSPSFLQNEKKNNEIENFSYREALEYINNNKKNDVYNCVSPKAIAPIISPLNSLYRKKNR